MVLKVWKILKSRIKNIVKHIIRITFLFTAIGIVRTHVNLFLNRKKKNRMLEIGPGHQRLQDFETLNIVYESNVDYVLDASRRLPFNDNTFKLVYASHVLEHIPWFASEQVLKEWVRIIEPEGCIEVWVPDALKISKLLIETEEGLNKSVPDNWLVKNPDKDPYLWVAGRIFTYGDGKRKYSHPNWHRAMFTPRYLRRLLEKAGLKDIIQLDSQKVRGYDHGWINLGMKATKK
jgi:ubiquinone/menaquinone biosynthesis C-methylase UbiE